MQFKHKNSFMDVIIISQLLLKPKSLEIRDRNDFHALRGHMAQRNKSFAISKKRKEKEKEI